MTTTPSTVLNTAASALTTSTGHTWAVATPFPVRVNGVRVGRIFMPYHSVPKGLEGWQYEADIVLQTELMVPDSADIAALAYDYAKDLHQYVKPAFSGHSIEARNGDRHCGIEILNRQNVEQLPANIVLISTTHLYRVQFKAALLSL